MSVLTGGKIYAGNTGTKIILDTHQDISTATVRKILVKKPNGDEFEWTAVAEAIEAPLTYPTKISYTTIDGDFNEDGDYFIQAYIETPSWKGKGETVSFQVYGNFQ